MESWRNKHDVDVVDVEFNTEFNDADNAHKLQRHSYNTSLALQQQVNGPTTGPPPNEILFNHAGSHLASLTLSKNTEAMDMELREDHRGDHGDYGDYRGDHGGYRGGHSCNCISGGGSGKWPRGASSRPVALTSSQNKSFGFGGHGTLD